MQDFYTASVAPGKLLRQPHKKRAPLQHRRTLGRVNNEMRRRGTSHGAALLALK